MNTGSLVRYFTVVFLAAGVCLGAMSSMTYAERNGTLQVGGSVVLFGDTYTVNGIDVQATAFAGGGAMGQMCGMSLGFYQGATDAADRLYLGDECNGIGGTVGQQGEDVFILTGTTGAPNYQFTAASTSSYAIDAPAPGAPPEYDPVGIDWISEANTGVNADSNVRFVSGNVFSSTTEVRIVGFDNDQFPMNTWMPAVFPDLDYIKYNSNRQLGRLTGSCTNAVLPTPPTRMYIGGTNTIAGQRHFFYMAFDLATGSFVTSGTESVLLDGIGFPDSIIGQPEQYRDLKGLASDGTYYYVMAKKPGVSEAWLYRYTTFPDPTPGANTIHPQTPDASQMDTATGISWPGATNWGRAGITCGRMVNVAGTGVLRPVFYVLCGNYLYTLVPTAVTATPTPAPTVAPTPTSPPASSVQGETWIKMR